MLALVHEISKHFNFSIIINLGLANSYKILDSLGFREDMDCGLVDSKSLIGLKDIFSAGDVLYYAKNFAVKQSLDLLLRIQLSF